MKGLVSYMTSKFEGFFRLLVFFCAACVHSGEFVALDVAQSDVNSCHQQGQGPVCVSVCVCLHERQCGDTVTSSAVARAVKESLSLTQYNLSSMSESSSP